MFTTLRAGIRKGEIIASRDRIRRDTSPPWRCTIPGSSEVAGGNCQWGSLYQNAGTAKRMERGPNKTQPDVPLAPKAWWKQSS
jgi:hypothetical protein